MLWLLRMFLLLYWIGLFWKSFLDFDRLTLYGGINIRDKEDLIEGGGGSYANMMKKLESEAPMVVIYYYIILYRRIKFRGS